MDSFTIEYLPVAEDDLSEIFGHIAADNKTAAHKVLNDMDESVKQLALFPKIGVIPKNRRLANNGYRMLITGNYLVFYRIHDTRVRIYRILSARRNYLDILI